jgi:hypothetical protein
MSARCLRCGAGNEWIEGKATHRAEAAPQASGGREDVVVAARKIAAAFGSGNHHRHVHELVAAVENLKDDVPRSLTRKEIATITKKTYYAWRAAQPYSAVDTVWIAIADAILARGKG